MLLKIFDADGVAYPLCEVQNGRIEHKENGCDKLCFSLDVRHELYPLLAEETRVHYGRNAWLVKKIQDDAIECELDFDFLKSDLLKDFSYSNKTLSYVLSEVLPADWAFIGAEDCTVYRGKSYSFCTRFEVVNDCIEKFGVRFVWNILDKTLYVKVPETIVSKGVYFTDQLNLTTLSFQGSSVDFVTRLYPYGKDGLSIAEINNGVEYIENHGYSNKVVCAYWVDERYTNALSLLEDAYIKLEALAKPERSYECSIRDLAKQSNKYSALSFEMHDKITLVVTERKLKVLYSIVKYVEYPDSPEANYVTLSCVPETIQSFTQALVEANVNNAIVVAEKALEQTDNVDKKVETLDERVNSTNERAEQAFSKAEIAFGVAETTELSVKEVKKGLAQASSKYYTGPYSQTYGRLFPNAVEIMEIGMIYIPTKDHTESFGEIEVTLINSGTVPERATATEFDIYSSGTLEDNRSEAIIRYAGTPPSRFQNGSLFAFIKGLSYEWTGSGWRLSSAVFFSSVIPKNAKDGEYWYCEDNLDVNGVKYDKDTVYRLAKTEEGKGLWVASASLADSFVYKNITSLLDSVVSIDAKLNENSAQIELITGWKTQTTETISALQQKTNANEANITTLLSFMGDTNKGAIKAIADLEAKVSANGASINSLVAWMGNTNNGAIKAIADVTQKANANESSISQMTVWQSNTNQSIANLQERATKNEASISLVVDNGKASGSLIIGAINDESTAKISAERLDIEGKTLNIKVASTNITGTITASQINTNGLNVGQGTIGGWSIVSDRIQKNKTGIMSNDSIVLDSLAQENETSPLRIFTGFGGVATGRKTVTVKCNVTASGYFGQLQDISYFAATAIDFSLLSLTFRAPSGKEYSLTEYNIASAYRNTFVRRLSSSRLQIQGQIDTLSPSTDSVTEGVLVVQFSYATSIPCFAVLDDGSLFTSTSQIRANSEEIFAHYVSYSMEQIAKVYVDTNETNKRFTIETFNRGLALGTDVSGVTSLLKGSWYCNASLINSSDRNVKNTICDLSAKYSDFFDYLRPVSYMFNNGTSGRTHLGLIAQEVADALEKVGLTTLDFAGVCYNLDENGNKVNWGIRYDELIALIISELQSLKGRFFNIESKMQ